jgi:hypothetical protein
MKTETITEFILIFTILVLISVLYYIKTIGNKKCVCLLCHKPNATWFKFLSSFKHYDVYIIIDDNSENYKTPYKNINIIQIPDKKCEDNGFSKLGTLTIPKNVIAWDKSIYYFSKLNKNYEHVWIFEDDVFFYNEDTLLNIYSKYKNSDLLSTRYLENPTGAKDYWWWNQIEIKDEPPYYNGMMCIVRLSNEMFNKMGTYADKYNTLYFLEALFPTICKKNNLIYDTPNELDNIDCCKAYTIDDDDMNTKNVYHHVKDFNNHELFRNVLKDKQ